MEKEVQKRSSKKQRSSNLNLSIYHLFKQKKRPAEICDELKISKSNLAYYTSYLKRRGILKKEGYGIWTVVKDLSDSDLKKEVQKRSSKKSSLGTRPKTNLHALQINFPILSGEVKDKDWKVGEKLKNWIPKYKGVDILGGLTIKNNNNKSITIFAKSRDILSLEEIDNLSFQIRAYAWEFFKNKHGVVLDVMNAQVKNLNIATEDRNSEGMIRKGEKFELDLNKTAEKIFPKDSIKGKAWIDGSPWKFTAETNDKEWKLAYLQMPFAIRDLTQNSFQMVKEVSEGQMDLSMTLKQIHSNMTEMTKILVKISGERE